MSEYINGVDRDALVETIKAVEANTEVADFQFRLENRWVNGGENRSTIDGYRGACQEHRRARPFMMINDEPPVLLGADAGPNPVEYVLHALAGCLTTSVVYHAAAKRIPVRAVSTRFEGDLDLRGFLGMSDDVRRGYKEVRVMFDIDADMDDEGKRQLIAMGEKYSPVFEMVSAGVPVRCMLAKDAAMSAAA